MRYALFDQLAERLQLLPHLLLRVAMYGPFNGFPSPVVYGQTWWESLWDVEEVDAWVQGLVDDCRPTPGVRESVAAQLRHTLNG